MIQCRLISGAVAALVSMLPFCGVSAQGSSSAYPAKTIRLIVPFAAAGGTDILARTLAQRMTDLFGHNVLVDNRAGGGGTIGAEMLVRAPPDGYTLILMSGSYATNAALFKLAYDPVLDTSPVSLVGEAPFMIAVNPAVPAKNVAELIALARAKPNSLNFASTGTGGITHLAYELFNLMAGTTMTHIPYKGTGALMADLLGGHVHLTFGGMLGMMPQVKTGKLRGVGVTSLQRNSAVPDIPAVAEAVPGYEVVNWYGVWGPKHMPKEIVTRLHATIAKALNAPDMKSRMAAEGVDPIGGPPAQMLQVLKREIPKWQRVVKEAGVQPLQ